MIVRPWMWLAGSISLIGALVALLPSEREALEVQIRSAPESKLVPTLETAERRFPDDAKIAERLLSAYERTGRPLDALRQLKQHAHERRLSPQERELAKRCAYAISAPDRAYNILDAAPQPHGLSERRELLSLALESSRLGSACAQARAIAQETPADASAWSRLRDLSLANRDLVGALDAQKRLARLQPGPETAGRLADLYVQFGNSRMALSALETYPQETPAFHRRAAELAEWANMPGAAVPHLKALYADKAEPALGLRLARALMTSRAPEGEAFVRALAAAFPQDVGIQAQFLSALAALGHADEVAEHLKGEVERSPFSHEAHERLMAFAIAHALLSQASDEAQRWLAARPQDAPERHRLAVLLGWQGRVNEAWSAYADLAASKALTPSWRREWLALSSPLEDATPEGVANLEALCSERRPDAQWLRRLATAQMELDHVQEAIQAQRRLVALVQGDRADALRLAQWLLWHGQEEEGLSRLQGIAQASPLETPYLYGAIDASARRRDWKNATFFLERLCQAQPDSADSWEALANAREANGQRPEALDAWKERAKRNGHGILSAVALCYRLGLEGEAENLLVSLGDRAGLAEVQELARLASRLKHPAVEEGALKRWLNRVPDDLGASADLAELLDGQGRAAEASEQYASLAARAPSDAERLAPLAARAFYSAVPERAQPFIARLEALAPHDAVSLRLLADYHQPRTPQKAGAYLDALHRAGAGDAETYFRRGEIAQAEGDAKLAERCFALAAAHSPETPEDAATWEAATLAHEHLGNAQQALARWRQEAASAPERLAPRCALARAALAANDLAAADRHIQVAMRTSADALEPAMLRAEWQLKGGRPGEAIATYAALRQAHPNEPYIVAGEASALHQAGYFRRADALLRPTALRGDLPGDFAGLYRTLHQEAASSLSARGFLEQYALLDRLSVESEGVQALDDRLAVLASVSTNRWAAGQLESRDAGIGARWRQGAWEAEARAALPFEAGSWRAPLAAAALRYEGEKLNVRFALKHARWDETDKAAKRQGRESKGELETSFQAAPWLGLRAVGSLGQLSLDGASPNLAWGATGEAVLRANAESPWRLAYQLQSRSWGELGSKVGLRDTFRSHVFGLGYGGRLGPWRLDVQPGYQIDFTSGQGAPLLNLALAYEFGLDGELTLNATWGGRALSQGMEGAYGRLELGSRWWF